MNDEVTSNLIKDEDDYPDPQPCTVPAGTYTCQLAGGCAKRDSQYPNQPPYYEMPLVIKDHAGNTLRFKFNFNQKNVIYGEIIKLLGGKELPSRVIKAPPKTHIIGKRFMAQVIERQAKNDKARIVNDILRVWAFVESEGGPESGPAEESKEPESKQEAEIEPVSDDEVPF